MTMARARTMKMMRMTKMRTMTMERLLMPKRRLLRRRTLKDPAEEDTGWDGAEEDAEGDVTSPPSLMPEPESENTSSSGSLKVCVCTRVEKGCSQVRATA
jgi:hypothetical protein